MQKHLTQLEAAAIALVNEVESNIRLGVPLTTALVNAADRFRKVQAATQNLIGADLDDMYKRVKQQEEGNVNVKPFRRLKLIKTDEE